ncbi:MAG: efflux RND transporter periplasmic adaptor subunit [Myxococcales bacterium]|nr:efflux RND transporter periplasmic adaptor subunit [Myxococcales bacterium]
MTATHAPGHPHALPGGTGRRGAPASRAGRRWAIAVAALIVIAAGLIILFLRLHRRGAEAHERSRRQAEAAKGLRVSVTRVKTTPAERVVRLPGDVRGFDQATLYAKLSGYVREVRVERGQRVKRGDVLATIESPEYLNDVAAARHDADVTRRNAERAERLAPSGIVAAQDRDNAVAQARVASANLARAQNILGYSIVRAPFDGVVTARYVDPGALLPAATGSTQSALPLVDLTDVDDLRIFVYVGQDAAPFVHPGDAVTVWQDEMPAKRIPAVVTRSAGALDPRARTMQVEIVLDNRTWRLLPGTFAHVEIHLTEPATPLLPDEAIVVRDGKTMVTRVDGNRAHYVEVDLGFNDGRSVRVRRGLEGGEIVGVDVPVGVQEGDPVQPVDAPAAAEGASNAPH